MTLEEKIISVLAEDLGPSAHSFLTKECIALNKDSSSITQSDLGELANLMYSGIKPILGEEIAEKVKQKILQMKN